MELVEGRATVESVDAFVADLGAIGEEHDCAVQAFDARTVVDEAHLRRAVELADRAFERGETIARDRGVEILLYAAGRRQINQALALGVSEGEVPVVVVVHGGGPAGRDVSDERAAAEAVAELLEPAETLGQYDERRVCSFYDVTDAERAATDASLSELVRERVALLTVEK
ncbi:KEOPS complex subunit Cgi121 [Halomarina oriensis]|uniref:KEOPS complex component n=1 Tax=Halomarina oriensis TaxID=671145 RepID=A0A6B0GIR9_9EURY|nr:KEOPS complex subunit Cgi121 [Halomarina oriensis]MWG34772.1 KEOPS complex component [Halomarina oriensis]